tara:strand:- start:693 stop:860 length:168 start_codon:yes stop_codon:yes gene_type:complete
MEVLALIGVFRKKFPFNKKIGYFLEKFIRKLLTANKFNKVSKVINNISLYDKNVV